MIDDLDPRQFAWQDRANCLDADPDDFFPDDKWIINSKEHRAAVAHAKDLCGKCEVQQTCLSFAIEHGIVDGIWGGLTASGRKELKYPRQRVDGRLTYLKEGSR